jgi:hypothetical protein
MLRNWKTPNTQMLCEAAGVDFRAFVLETFGGCVTNVEEVVQSGYFDESQNSKQ